ncbi:lipopolysaccharide biosynthesis protein WzxC [Abditibacteriota bacterium]|nr:lipopolysaccharide biosynthesis protein WzxC [Abditibacteriota bacterium]
MAVSLSSLCSVERGPVFRSRSRETEHLELGNAASCGITLGAFVSRQTWPQHFFMIGRFRKSNHRRAASPRQPLSFRSGGEGGHDNPLRRDRSGAPIFFEAVTELPPVIESDVTRPFLPVLPESNLSGAHASPSDLQTEEDALGTRVMKGVSWTLAGTLLTQVLGVARTVVLARLLNQADFGVAAMALTVIGALYTLTNTSVGASVISARFEDDNELKRYVNLIWTMEIGRGVLISVLLLALAFPFAYFYKEPRLFPMLLALALTPLCTSLQNVGLHLQSRRVETKALALHGLYSSAVSVIATLILAVATHNYWALVWGQVAGAFATTALSFVFSSYRPRLFWDWIVAKRAFEYGKHQFVIGLSDYALTMMDNVLVGYWLGKEILGIYVVAYSFCTLARTLVNNAFNRVIFPAFASAGREDDPERLRSLVERTFTLGTMALTALLTPLIAFAPAVLRVIYGTKWSDAATPMRLLLVAGFFSGLLSLFSAFFVGLDRPQLESKGKVWDAILFLIVLCPLTLKFGAVGAALTGIVAWAGASTWRWKWANDLVPMSLKRLPYLLISSMAIGVLACALGVLPWSQSAGSWLQAFELSTPSLGVAWLQLLLGAPLVGAFCLGMFSLVHPVARHEMAGLKSKIGGKLKRG